MKSCDNCVHFLDYTRKMNIDVTPICLLEFHFYNAFNWEWFQPSEYYSKPNTRCPHHNVENKV